MWEAQPRDKNNNKRQKDDNNNTYRGNQNKKYNGDFHTLLEKLERVKESVNKALQQQQTTTRKRKSSDQREENIAQDNNSTGNPNDTFVDEIDQLSVSEDDVNRK